MVILRIPVECHFCSSKIEKRNALIVKNPINDKIFQCFSCFRRNLEKSSKEPEKVELYCERCKYKFSSTKLRCPYCNQFDAVVKGKIVIKDLL
jgi:hypothetical protein